MSSSMYQEEDIVLTRIYNGYVLVKARISFYDKKNKFYTCNVLQISEDFFRSEKGIHYLIARKII